MKTLNLTLATLITGITVLTACSKAPNAEDITTTADTTPSANVATYTVSVDPYYPPFEYRDADGSIIGFDVDLLNAIAEKEGFTYQFVAREILDIVQGKTVEVGEQDMAASSIFILEDRQDVLNYSNSYFSLPLVFVGLEQDGRPQNIDEVTGKNIAVQQDIIMEDIVDNEFVPKGNTKIGTKTSFLGLKDVLAGKADIILDNVVSIKHFQKSSQGHDLFYLQLPDSYSLQLGYVVAKDNDDLRNKLNHGIEAVKADGTYAKIYDKWFGPNSQQPLDINIAMQSSTTTANSSVEATVASE